MCRRTCPIALSLVLGEPTGKTHAVSVHLHAMMKPRTSQS